MTEQFSRPEPDTIVSTLGFTVKSLDSRGVGVRYSEGGHTLDMDSEGLMGHPSDMVIYSDSITNWDPPFGSELIDPASRERILHNVVRAFASQGMKVHFT
jgi:hypothetical protein